MTEDERSGNRLWRYVPVIIWMAVIFVASTGELSGANTSRIIRPILLWLFPDISEERISIAHLFVRKVAHFIEYAVFALLIARALTTSSHALLRRRYFNFALLLVIVYSFSDELHQRFVATRTGSIYDSFLDIAGGLSALIVYAVWRQKKQSEESFPNDGDKAIES